MTPSPPPSPPPSPHRLAIYQPPQGDLVIAHEDEHLLVLDKPAGLLTVPGKDPDHSDCLESRAKQHTPSARIVHRLDMATSGLVVLAKTPHAHRHLGLQFEKRQVAKTYRAVVHGFPSTQTGTIDLPLICDWPNRPKQRVDLDRGKSAITHWQRGKVLDEGTEMTLYPKTGRSHQLRVHMLAMGYPIVGDPFYGPPGDTAPRLMLHAARLSLRHPDGGAQMDWQSEPDFTG